MAGRLATVFDGQLIGVDVGGTKVAVATLEDARLSDSLVRPTEVEHRGLVEEIVAGVDEVRDAHTAGVGVGVAVGDRVRHRPGALQRRPPPRRLRSQRALGTVWAAGVRRQRRRPCPTMRRSPRLSTNRAGRSCRTWSCSRWAPGSAAGWCSAGRSIGGRPARPGSSATRWSGADLSQGVPPSLSFRSAARSSRWPPAGSWTTWRRRSPPTVLLGAGEAGGRGQGVDGHDAVEAAKAGDPEAIEALRTLGERLGIGIANALNTFDPDEVVVGGGVSARGSCCSARPGCRAALRPPRRRRAHRDPAGPPREPGGRSRRRAARRAGAGRGRRGRSRRRGGRWSGHERSV